MVTAIQRARAVGQRFLIPPERSPDMEILDDNVHDPGELAENFRDIRRVNHLLGGTSVILRQLPWLLDAVPATQSISILDLATGTADIPLAIVRWAKRHDRTVQVTASDVSDQILSIARDETRGHPEITIERHDARSVPLPDNQFDLVICSLSLHHFTPEDAVQVLREMRRLARHGIILNDLYRTRAGYALTWIAARVTTRNRLTRNDAPLSVLRAYSPDELRDLLRQAGCDTATITKHLWFRMVAVERKANHGR